MTQRLWCQHQLMSKVPDSPMHVCCRNHLLPGGNPMSREGASRCRKTPQPPGGKEHLAGRVKAGVSSHPLFPPDTHTFQHQTKPPPTGATAKLKTGRPRSLRGHRGLHDNHEPNRGLRCGQRHTRTVDYAASIGSRISRRAGDALKDSEETARPMLVLPRASERVDTGVLHGRRT